jgi:hypothetical protein
MTRQRNSITTRQAIFDDHGGEMRFWLGWVHGEIDGAVRDWFRTQSRHDPALRQDLDSIDTSAARDDVRRALEATNYLVAAPSTAAARPTLVEDLDDVTNLVLQSRTVPPAPAAIRERLAPLASAGPARAAARTRGSAYAPSAAADPSEQPRRLLRQAIDQLTTDERCLLFAQWQTCDACRESLLRVLLPEEDQPPPRGELSDQGGRLRRAETHLGQALGNQRDLLREIGPQQLLQILSEDYTGTGTNGRGPAPPPSLPAGGTIRKRRSAADAEVYRRIARSLFKLLAAVDIPLPARDEAGEATRLLQDLVGRQALSHFRELTSWLRDTRARMDLASDPSFYTARDRLLLWLAPDCFLTDGSRAHFELSFRLYLRARLKDYCRRKGWQPAAAKARDLETAFRALDRERIGDIVRETVEEAARAEEQPPALIGVPLAQALQWLQAAP